MFPSFFIMILSKFYTNFINFTYNYFHTSKSEATKMFDPTHSVDKNNKSFREKFVDFYHEINGLIPINFWWFLMCIPIVTIPPATAGLFYAAYKNKNGEAVTRQTFFEGFKKYALFSYIRAGINIILAYVFTLGLSVYTQMEWKYSTVFAGLLALFALVWAMLQVYSLPIVFEMKTKNYFFALQNSFLLLFLKPGRTLSTLLFNIVMMVISIVTFLPLLVFTGAAIAMNTLITMEDSLAKLNKTVEDNRERMGLDPEEKDSKFPPLDSKDVKDSSEK